MHSFHGDRTIGGAITVKIALKNTICIESDLKLLSMFIIHIKHYFFVLFNRSPYSEQLCSRNNACQSNCSLNINKYVINLLLRTSLCFFLNLNQTTAVIISRLSRSIIIEKKVEFCPLVSKNWLI